MNGVYVTGRGWRYHRRLRPLVVRPRSRELLDRLGLIVGLIYVENRRPSIVAQLVEDLPDWTPRGLDAELQEPYPRTISDVFETWGPEPRAASNFDWWGSASSADDTKLTLFCSTCDVWSPADAWEDGWADDRSEDDDAGEGYVACPLCGHHFPPLDPPARTYRRSPTGWVYP